MAATLEEHNLQLLNEKVNSLLKNEYECPLTDNLTFNFQRSEDLLTCDVFSLLLKPASLVKVLEGHKNLVSKIYAFAWWRIKGYLFN